FLIITSTEDKASMNIRDTFLKSNRFQFKKTNLIWHGKQLYKFENLHTKNKKNNHLIDSEIYLGLTDDPLIYLNNLKLDESDINPEILIFASRHRSQAQQPAFLIHTTGNWSQDAEFGGNPQEISHSSAILLKSGLLSLVEQAKISSLNDFSLDIEVTHHGPTTLEKPLIFMELGSSEKEWEIKSAGNVVALAIIETVFKYLQLKKEDNQKVAIGFGGTHYAPQFKKLILEKDIAVSFICPKYFVQDLTKKMIEQMINKNLEKLDFFIIDWKGTNSADKQHLISLLEQFDIPIRKSKDF
ncbi:MAG: hypothetical protein EU532_10550, partial [Promethearchaeota archaeon]